VLCALAAFNIWVTLSLGIQPQQKALQKAFSDLLISTCCSTALLASRLLQGLGQADRQLSAAPGSRQHLHFIYARPLDAPAS